MKETPIRSQLVDLYRQMAEMTAPECAGCRSPHSCCEAEYCLGAEEHAKARWGVEPKRTDHPKLPFMGESRCTLEPHLRPICTVHTCDVASIGCKRGDPEWTQKYFILREKIDVLEWDLEPAEL